MNRILEWLFGTEAENSFSEADDAAIMRVVRSRISHSYLEPESSTRSKIAEAARMRVWAGTLENSAEKKSYFRWIAYYVEGCERRLRNESHWREVKKAEGKISAPPIL